MPSSVHLRVESLVAQAHRRVWLAARAAESLVDQGLAEDLYALAVELERLNLSLVRESKRAARKPV